MSEAMAAQFREIVSCAEDATVWGENPARAAKRIIDIAAQILDAAEPDTSARPEVVRLDPEIQEVGA